ncbi:hypothetical protein OPKNFCMD_4612 [Methylobacterium crusticola]|uniref:DUF4381 domain-containing protein n=1 Tax=Methylobacterium crusticola TaxID=1697972 RepID=A0ABQ4R2K5_9HYPH|nr:DUF4381 family protein [Methylobacterium crusticola]GJD51853.1 hypothetical protein OPKNFCMD_4612 [Methylobacterium crusticola]
MPCCEAALADLRGLHAPPDPGLIRLDVAAALVLGLVLAGVAALLGARLARRRGPVRRAALAELAAARSLDPASRHVALARLVRRLARTLGVPEAGAEAGAEAERAAGLDRRLSTDFFSRGPGRALVFDLYAPGPAPDLGPVEDGLARLLARLRA